MPIYDISGNEITVGGSEGSAFFDITPPAYSNIFSPERDGYDDNTKLGSDGALIALAGSVTSGFVDVSKYVGKYVIPQYGNVATVNPNTVYTTYPYYTYLCFYDANKSKVGSLVSAATGDYTTARNPVQIPNGAVYMRCSWNISYGGTRTVEVWQLGVFAVDTANGTIPFEPFYADGEPKSAYIKQSNFRLADKPMLYSKKWTLFGDSLTDSFGGHDWQKSSYTKGEYGTIGDSPDVPWTDYFWASKIAREFGLTLDNRAKSGSNMYIPDTGNAYYDVNGIFILDAFLAQIANEEIEQPDIITIGFGTNCLEGNQGSPTDTSAQHTKSYYGATRYYIENLREHCPKSVFGFVLPPVCNWDSSARQEGVPLAREAIREVCDAEGVPYIDMSKESGITTAMLPDGVHVSSHQANNLYCHAMRRFVMEL